MEPRKIFFAAAGWLDEKRGNLEKLFDELVERGRLRSGDPGETAESIIEKVRGERREADKIFQEIAQDAIETLGLATAEDIGRASERLEAVEQQIKSLKSGATRPARRKNTGSSGKRKKKGKRNTGK